MFEKIRVKNYENHKDSTIVPSPETTIISGESDEGKSAFFRAIKLGLKNNPSGYAYKPHTAKAKDVTEVSILLPEGEVVRRRGDSVDEYKVNAPGCSKEPYTALNRQVPEDISRLFNLGDYAYQEQHDSFFFVAKTVSGGERARLLNEVSGLEIIDRSQAKIKSLITKNNTELEQAKEKATQLEQKLEKVKFVDAANVLLTEIEQLFSEHKKLSVENEQLEKYREQLVLVEKDIKRLQSFLKVKTPYGELLDFINEYDSLRFANHNLQEYISKLTEVEEVINDNNEFLKSKPMCEEVLGLILQHQEMTTKGVNLEKYLNELNNLDIVIKDTVKWLECKNYYSEILEYITLHKQLDAEGTSLLDYAENLNRVSLTIKNGHSKREQLKKERDEYMKQFNLCPFCKREWEK